jgi:outer membrane protein assembly factor BamD (BamD/ComL family)
VLEEASLLETARAAIAQGNVGLALSQLDEHRARFPHGALREEARAARVLALCAGGRSREARAAALAFIADNPRSPLVAAMRGACAEPGPGSIVGPR